jgi:glycerol-3-phosphate O-acyltransferase
VPTPDHDREHRAVALAEVAGLLQVSMRMQWSTKGSNIKPHVLGGGSVAREVTSRVMRDIARTARDEEALDDMLVETLYREQQRLLESDGLPNDATDREHIKALRHDFAHAHPGDKRALLERIVSHYAAEIAGHFDPRVYSFATSIVPSALGALLHGGKPSPHLFDVDERILLEGEVQPLLQAARRGTVVLVPTHASNLDSLVLGYAIYRLGLPPFAYGAGLNLFSNPILGFFMRHLGTFTVDRAKLDPLYLTTVKEYATALLEHGQHMLFFPGGTRSRSGALESHLKLGFLGRVLSAFVNRRIASPTSPPMFVVPCTLSYPLVLEAESLIEQYLSQCGGPHFIDVRDELAEPSRWLGFLRGLGSLDVEVHVRFGRPLDPFGNFVDDDGVALDARGRALDPVRYVLSDGVVVRDELRDAEYTRFLSQQLTAAYKRDSVALPSSVLAFAAFSCLHRRFPRLDLFRFLRVIGPTATLPLTELEAEIDVVLAALSQLAAANKIQLAPELRAGGRAAILEHGLATLGAYHRPAVLRRRGPKDIEVTQPTLLFYYRNHLDGYGLPGSFAMPTGRERSAGWGLT